MNICRSLSYASRVDYSPQYVRYKVARPVGGAEDLDARPVRKEERAELENVVISGEGLRRRSARLKQAMNSAENQNQKQPIAVTRLQHEFNLTNEMDQELQHFSILRTEGEALEIVRGAERENRFGTMAGTGCFV